MPIEKLRPSFTFTEDRIKELKQVVPEAFADGKINWDVLREALDEHLEDEAQEHFGLSWPGKREARRLASMPSKGTLVPQPGEGVYEENTRNIFIEGDNLEILKILQKSYVGKIKMIYIDPPYNTGNDYIYKDDYREPLTSYLRRSKQSDEAGQLLTTNTRASGRFHSNWLNMLYPRILLARQLLSDDGVIFVSIDDNEVHNLKHILGELFGEENYIATIIWKKRSTPPNDKIIGAQHEYILLFSKNFERVILNLRERSQKQIERYTNPDNHPKGPWAPGDLMANVKGGRFVQSLNFPIINPETGEKHYPGENGNWRFSHETIKKLINNNEIYFGEDGKGKPKLKRFLCDVKPGVTWTTLWDFVPLNTKGSREMEDIFGSSLTFESPKPSGLIKELIRLGSDQSAIVLDFFAGSCTTAHALLEQNIEDGGQRQFIMIQLPETLPTTSPAYKAGYKTISEVGKERIRRICKDIQKEQKEEDSFRHIKNLGFKIFHLEHSNFKSWESYESQDSKQLEILFDHFETPLIDGWKQCDLLTEILLLEGYPLDSQVIPLDAFTDIKIQRVNSEFCLHELFVCLDETINEQTINHLDLKEQDIFVCLDTALSDEAKAQLADRCNLKVI
jgi:adenine-specific DNA-methyltransferase